MFEINGHTQQIGIIGYPVEHSFSPVMHNFISDAVHNNFIYSAYCVPPERLGGAIEGMRALGFKGLNVTAPHKVEVMQYLDEVSESARELGSVNTVVNHNGRLVGYNTDADGFCMSLEKGGITIKGSKILIIGAGGVTRPVLVRLIDYGASSVTVLNRTHEKAVLLAEDIFNVKNFKINTNADTLDFDIVINTTSAGMEPQEDKLPTDSISEIKDLSFINENTAVVDMIYNPDETLFLKEARLRGAKTMNGLGMLIYQGIIAYELFTGASLPDDMGELIKKEVFHR